MYQTSKEEVVGANSMYNEGQHQNGEAWCVSAWECGAQKMVFRKEAHEKNFNTWLETQWQTNSNAITVDGQNPMLDKFIYR